MCIYFYKFIFIFLCTFVVVQDAGALGWRLVAENIYFTFSICSITRVLYFTNKWEAVGRINGDIICSAVCQWKVGDQKTEIRCSVLEDPWWTTALVFTCGRLHYFSMYRDSGERIPSKFDQRDYKPLRTRSFKPHLCCLQGPQYITPSVQCIYQPPPLPPSRLAAAGLPRSEEDGRACWQNWGLDPAGSRECEALPTAVKWRFEWVQIHHAGVAVGRERWPRWKLSVMIDGCTSASEPSESALPWSANCRRPQSIAVIGPQQKGNQWIE